MIKKIEDRGLDFRKLGKLPFNDQQTFRDMIWKFEKQEVNSTLHLKLQQSIE